VIWAIDLKRGMELGPWAACIDRLATTPAEARALLADAVAILDGRAGHLAATGKRVWEPSPQWPALRVCFRVRERRDVDLILGQGMLVAGWQAHTLNAPGKFLISAPEHDTPRRARAYLVTDEAVTDTASRHAPLRPRLDEVSLRALAERPASDPQITENDPGPGVEPDAEAGPAALLWTALRMASEDGVPVADLVSATGMSHRWVNYRLKALADAGRAIQIRRGVWRPINTDCDSQ
jgi:S-DNA-T family DNA segregation ATPase FtsK/SpoIIIE